MTRLPVLWLVLVVVGLSGCSLCARRYCLAEAGTHEINGAYAVETTTAWSRLVSDGTEMWTVEGPLLEQLRLYALEDGDALFPRIADERDKFPAYRKRMREVDVIDFVVASIMGAGGSNVETNNVRPARFGAHDGFRFDLLFRANGGLEYRGLAIGALTDENRLYLILYFGAQLHYFERHLDQVERIIGSVRGL